MFVSKEETKTEEWYTQGDSEMLLYVFGYFANRFNIWEKMQA